MNDTFIQSIAGFALGIFLASIAPQVFGFAAAFLFLVVGAAVFLLARARLVAVPVIPLFFLCLSVAAGVIWFQKHITPDELHQYVGAEVSLSGTIQKDPDARDTIQRLVIDLDEVIPHVLVSADRYPEFAYGDRVNITGVLLKPEPFSVGNDRVFQYDTYLAKDGILYEMFRPDISKREEAGGNIFYRSLFSIKRQFLEKLYIHIPEPAAALAAGELLGEKQALGKDLLNAFVTTSVVHVVVLSGYNISIIVIAVLFILSWLRFSRNATLFFAGAIIVSFVIMTGAEAPAVRASAMALIFLFARGVGRAGDATRLLFIAGALMLVHNPQLLVFDPAFQLSFVATLGLVHLTPRIMPYIAWVPGAVVREMVSATVAAQLAVLPLLLYFTGVLSVVALPANLLVLLIVPYAMFAAFVTGVLAFLSPVLAMVPAGVATALLQYQVVVVLFFAKLPFAVTSIPAFSAAILLVVYAAAAGILYLRTGNAESA